jgi:Uma2 family endonuclease
MRQLTLPLPSGDTWTRAEYEALPEDLPIRVGLVHGALVVSPRRRPICRRIARRLATRIEDALPDAWQVDTDVDVLLDDDQFEPVEIAPDIVVYSAAHDPCERPIPGELVALVVDVMSPSAKREDRRIYPALYAEAGIPHYWRVATGQAAIHTCGTATVQAATGRPRRYCTPRCKRVMELRIRAARRRVRRAQNAADAWRQVVTGQDPLAEFFGTPGHVHQQSLHARERLERARADLAALLEATCGVRLTDLSAGS